MSTGLKANSDGSAAIQVGGTDVITLTSGGAATFVTSPTTVQAGTAAAPSITFSGDTNTGIYSPGADTIAFTEGGAEVARFDSSGNFGLATSSPFSTSGAAVLTVGGSSSSKSGRLFLRDASNNNQIQVYISSTFNEFNSQSELNVRTEAGALRFTTANTERARITSGGYFKASDNGTYYGSTGTFHEFYQSANDTGLAIKAANASYTNSGFLVDISRNTTNNSFSAISYYNAGAGAYKFRVADSGTVTNTTGTYTTISDIKLKQDIVDASSQWDDIKALRIVKYRLKEYVQNDPDSKPFLGLIAQEVEQVSPGLVEEQEDEVMDEDGKLVKNGEVTKGVKTSILYMKAVKALQEAMTRIETLEAEVAALKGAA